MCAMLLLVSHPRKGWNVDAYLAPCCATPEAIPLGRPFQTGHGNGLFCAATCYLSPFRVFPPQGGGRWKRSGADPGGVVRLKNGKFARLRVKAVFLLEAHKKKDVIRPGADLFLRLPPRRDQIREIFGPLTPGKASAADRLSVCALLDVYRAWSLQKAE